MTAVRGSGSIPAMIASNSSSSHSGSAQIRSANPAADEVSASCNVLVTSDHDGPECVPDPSPQD